MLRWYISYHILMCYNFTINDTEHKLTGKSFIIVKICIQLFLTLMLYDFRFELCWFIHSIHSRSVVVIVLIYCKNIIQYKIIRRLLKKINIWQSNEFRVGVRLWDKNLFKICGEIRELIKPLPPYLFFNITTCLVWYR